MWSIFFLYQRVWRSPSEIAYRTRCLDASRTLAAGTLKLYLPTRKCEEENKHSVSSLRFIRTKGALSQSFGCYRNLAFRSKNLPWFLALRKSESLKITIPTHSSLSLTHSLKCCQVQLEKLVAYSQNATIYHVKYTIFSGIRNTGICDILDRFDICMQIYALSFKMKNLWSLYVC